MDNIVFKLKKTLQNRNTVTIIGVLLVLGLLYLGYNSQIEDAVVPLEVPVAAENIQPRTLITSEMVTTLAVPNVAVSENVILDYGLIVGRYTNVNAYIPAGSMFFTSAVVDASDLPDYGLSQLKEGELPILLKVDMESTYGNSILPGSEIDVYFKGTENDMMFVGKFLEGIKVITVNDSNGKPVFENTSEERTPDNILFGASEEIYLLMLRSKYIDDVELFFVPKGMPVDTGLGTEIKTYEAIVEYIKAKTLEIETSGETEETEDEVETEQTEMEE